MLRPNEILDVMKWKRSVGLDPLGSSCTDRPPVDYQVHRDHPVDRPYHADAPLRDGSREKEEPKKYDS